jgi:glutamyl-tRNA synthetase
MITLHDIVRGEIVFDYERVPQNPVLIKSDGFPTYHLATVVDDWEMGITHVLRGEEWIPSTPLHLQMFEALGYPPPLFIHLPLVTDHEGKKLKKRDPSFEASTYRESGFLPEAVVNYLALLGWHPGTEQEIFSPQELIDSFTIERFQKSPAAFNEDRLRWFNQQHMMRLSDGDIMRRALPLIEAVYPDAAVREESWLIALISSIREELTTLSDAPASVKFAFESGTRTEEAQNVLQTEQALPVLTAFQAAAQAADAFDAESNTLLLREIRAQFKESHGWGGRAVMFPLRAALTGSTTGPHLSDVAFLLGKEETLRRIEQTLAIMRS